MTIVEYLKSDGDVLNLVVLSIGAVGLCVILLSLITSKLRSWRKTPKRKPKPLQRPFIASNRISPTVKDGSPTFKYSPFNQRPSNRLSPSFSLNQSYTRASPSPVETPTVQSVSTLTEKQRTNFSPGFLSQVISSINKSNSKSPGRHSPSLSLSRVPKDYTNPFVLDHSTTDESTLPSLVVSSDTSNENIVEGASLQVDPKVTMDKGVNTDHLLQDRIENDNDIKDSKPTSSSDICGSNSRLGVRRIKDNFTLHLWSHKCRLPCVDELRTPCSPAFSNDSDILPDLEPDISENEGNHSQGPRTEHYRSRLDKYSGRRGEPSKKCSSDCFAQGECTGKDPKDCKTSPLCSSDSTVKELEHTLHCSCDSQALQKSKKQSKSPKKLKKSFLARSLERKLPEELEILENKPSIMDRTSFIPPKTWYSLGSLCDDEDENCESCGRNWNYDPHRNYHQRMYDSDTKLNLSSADAVSYNDTGYTSTDEEDSSNNGSTGSKGVSSRDHHSSPENGSYDGDYESDDEIFHCRLVGSDELVYKPQPSISEPFPFDTYAKKEWKGDTPTAKAIIEGYAAIPRYMSCHQLRQVRGDNYCAVRATLFQALVQGVPLLDNLPEGSIPQVLRTIQSTTNALQEWSFAGRISVNKADVISTLEEILVFYVDEVQRCQDIPSTEAKTDHLLALFNDDTGNSEFKLLEAVKLIMMYHAVLLYDQMNSGKVVPVLAWLLFARDTSCDPQALLRNHLNTVGDTGGLEQVEMCLLGHALGVVIQVFRPSQVSKPDFIANYPYLEDMPPLSPTVSLVAEDDRHYNIVVE